MLKERKGKPNEISKLVEAFTSVFVVVAVIFGCTVFNFSVAGNLAFKKMVGNLLWKAYDILQYRGWIRGVLYQ